MISDEEMAVLSEVQRLPLVSEPFAEIAKRLGMEEEKILDICQGLLSKGMIRRFGISLNHRKLGIKGNLMVIVNVPEEQIDQVGREIASEEGVTHCYNRTGWDYNLFFMIHSESKKDVVRRTNDIMKKLKIEDYKYMFSTREFKKISFEVPKPLDMNKTMQKTILKNSFQLPIVLNITGPVIIFGGGKVGKRKVEYISKFSNDITVIAKNKQDLPDFVKFYLIDLKPEDIPKYVPDNAALVVAALSDPELNSKISEYCIKYNILVNIVDNPELSTIYFPALSKFGDLNIAISTGGKCPFLSKKIRKRLDNINASWADWLEILTPVREKLVGIEEKNRILSRIYKDPEISTWVSNKELIKAKHKAEEIYHLYSKH